MNKQKWILAFVLFILGLAGVLSMLTMDIPIPEEAKAELSELFTKEQIKWLILVNPTILLALAVLLGVLFHEKVSLSVPLLARMVGLKQQVYWKSILISGIVGGLMAGGLLHSIESVYLPRFPEAFKTLSAAIQPSLASRFLYGGITEEILMRFGLMTFLTWLLFILFKTQKSWVYWVGISLSAIVFALGHLPIVYQAISQPSIVLISYVIIGNTVGGLIFGYLYWKKGLESACIAHIFTHIVLVLV